jgi:hypothetical protein
MAEHKTRNVGLARLRRVLATVDAEVTAATHRLAEVALADMPLVAGEVKGLVCARDILAADLAAAAPAADEAEEEAE